MLSLNGAMAAGSLTLVPSVLESDLERTLRTATYCRCLPVFSQVFNQFTVLLMKKITLSIELQNI
jgi:hypothetical protein